MISLKNINVIIYALFTHSPCASTDLPCASTDSPCASTDSPCTFNDLTPTLLAHSMTFNEVRYLQIYLTIIISIFAKLICMHQQYNSVHLQTFYLLIAVNCNVLTECLMLSCIFQTFYSPKIF